jgi:hypothetical protein
MDIKILKNAAPKGRYCNARGLAVLRAPASTKNEPKLHSSLLFCYITMLKLDTSNHLRVVVLLVVGVVDAPRTLDVLPPVLAVVGTV